jgi:uncharacterized protein DUF1573
MGARAARNAVLELRKVYSNHHLRRPPERSPASYKEKSSLKIHQAAGAILAFALMTAGAQAQTETAKPAKPQPKAVVVTPIQDFGNIQKTAKVTKEFEIRNDGNAPLLLREARPDCACAVADFDKEIAPGATGKVRAELDPAEFTGPIRKQIVVFTNDPAAPELQLTMVALVRPEVFIKPGYARYVYVQQEKVGVIAQTLWAADGRDFKVVAVESPYPYLKATFREATAEDRLPEHPGKQWKLFTTLDADAPVGPLTKPLIIRTDHPLQKEIEMEVSGFVRPAIVITPPTSDWGTLTKDEVWEGSLVVKTYTTDPIQITDAKIDLPGATATVTPVTEGRHYNVRLELPKTLPKGPFKAKVTIRTNNLTWPSVETTLSGVVE